VIAMMFMMSNDRNNVLTSWAFRSSWTALQYAESEQNSYIAEFLRREQRRLASGCCARCRYA
jgi:hypothetical protein